MPVEIFERKRNLVFLRQDTNKLKKLKLKWRKPKGLHSKLRLNKKGHQRTPSQGYRSPRKIRNLANPIIINSLKDLQDNIANNRNLIISSTLGLKKKIDVVKYAKENNLNILNIPNIDDFLKSVNEMISKKKEEKKKRQEKKQKLKKEVEKKEKPKEEKKEGEEKTRDKAQPAPTQTPVKHLDTKIMDKPTKTQTFRATAPKQK